MIILLCMLSFALAEPPVGDSYLEAAQLSQQYLPPDFTVPSTRTSKSFNAFSNQYLPPSTRGVSQEYGAPDTRQRLSPEYGLPTRETSSESEISKEYGTPYPRSTQDGSYQTDSNQRFSSAFKSSASDRYGTPSFKNSPSALYTSPSPQYDTPRLRSSNKYAASNSPVQKYGVPSARTQPHSKSISQEYGTPSISRPRGSLRYSNGFSSKMQNPQFVSFNNPSQFYGIPARSLSTQYGTPSVRNTVTRFEGSRSSNSKTNAYASPYPSSRSPSIEYGVPTSRATELSEEYEAHEGSPDNQGYDYARNVLENQNQESAKYDFAYKVSDGDTGSDFGHSETRQLDKAEGAYFVLLPDGTKQVVEYEADENGFRPRISVEHIDSPTALAAEGPY